jgi:hypothetical protein
MPSFTTTPEPRWVFPDGERIARAVHRRELLRDARDCPGGVIADDEFGCDLGVGSLPLRSPDR